MYKIYCNCNFIQRLKTVFVTPQNIMQYPIYIVISMRRDIQQFNVCADELKSIKVKLVPKVLYQHSY